MSGRVVFVFEIPIARAVAHNESMEVRRKCSANKDSSEVVLATTNGLQVATVWKLKHVLRIDDCIVQQKADRALEECSLDLLALRGGLLQDKSGQNSRAYQCVLHHTTTRRRAPLGAGREHKGSAKHKSGAGSLKEPMRL